MSSDGGMESAASRVWHAALLTLHDVLPESAFRACFGCTEALGGEGDVFTIGAPHRFAREWIDVRYRQAAEEALAAAAGRPLQLVVERYTPWRRNTANRTTWSGLSTSGCADTPPLLSADQPAGARPKLASLAGGTVGSYPGACPRVPRRSRRRRRSGRPSRA